MSREQKIVVTSLWIVVIIAMVGIVSTWATRSDRELPKLFPAPHFSLTDQNGKPLSDTNLHGSVWTAMVFFTSCPGICPAMSGRMRDLQSAVPDSRVKIVSLSIDPEKDTPEVLKRYADLYDAKQGRWFLLTGTKDQMFEAARGFNLTAMPATDTQPIVHSDKVLLIDSQGMVRGIYGTSSNEEMQQLAKDAAELARAIQ